jgi:hypothetical protein
MVGLRWLWLFYYTILHDAQRTSEKIFGAKNHYLKHKTQSIQSVSQVRPTVQKKRLTVVFSFLFQIVEGEKAE